ncbi:MAG: EF-hand domain-containing protein [Methylobacteriaceae bacterium]|jgi:Ca2+-binding EF-hand superfamily protein|nr:EF-hand domain-containing protein [Methylobacteriaceae bacterium]
MSSKLFYSMVAAGVLGVVTFAASANADARSPRGPGFNGGPCVNGECRGPGARFDGPGGFGPGGIFEQFDANKDGKVEKKEYSDAIKAEFDKYAKDGKLTHEGFEAMWSERSAPMRVRAFQRLDANDDNVISKDEIDRFAKRFESFFTRSGDKGRPDRDKDGRGFGGPGGPGPFNALIREADTDKDGKISAEEWKAFVDAKVAAADTDKDGNISQEEFAVLWNDFGKPMRIRAFQRLDADDDNVVTFEEFSKGRDALFDRMDRNNDGVVEKEELKSYGGPAPRERRGDSPRRDGRPGERGGKRAK